MLCRGDNTVGLLSGVSIGASLMKGLVRAGLQLVVEHNASKVVTLGIYTHVVDASHRKAVEDVEERLFGDSDVNGRKSASDAHPTIAATDGVQ